MMLLKALLAPLTLIAFGQPLWPLSISFNDVETKLVWDRASPHTRVSQLKMCCLSEGLIEFWRNVFKAFRLQQDPHPLHTTPTSSPQVQILPTNLIE